MIEWILLIGILTSDGSTIKEVHFTDQQSCEDASVIVYKTFSKTFKENYIINPVVVVCVENNIKFGDGNGKAN